MSADRFARLRRTRTFRDGGHGRWELARLGIVGAGNLGGRLAEEAARSGASVVICDPDVAREENLGTQHAEVGKPKAEVVASACNAVSPGRAEALVADVREAGVRVLACCQLLVDATDDAGLAGFMTEVSTGLGVPLIRVAVDGSGELELGRVLTSDGGNGHACQLCSRASLETDRGPTPCPGREPETPPTFAGGALGSTVAGIALLQAQRLLSDNDVVLARDVEVLVDLDHMQMLSLRLERSERCVSGHERWQIEGLGRRADEVTVGELVERARDRLGAAVSVAPYRSRVDLVREAAGRFAAAPLSEFGVPAAGALVLARAPGQRTVGYLAE